MTTINKKKANEQAVVGAIKLWYSDHRYGPSFRDIANVTGLSLGTVHNVCRTLREGGVLSYEDNIARSIKVTRKGNR